LSPAQLSDAGNSCLSVILRLTDLSVVTVECVQEVGWEGRGEQEAEERSSVQQMTQCEHHTDVRIPQHSFIHAFLSTCVCLGSITALAECEARRWGGGDCISLV
jgi:hypothetical protein